MKLKVLNPDNTGLTKEMIALREKRMKQIARPDTQIDMEVQEKTKICVDSALDVAVTSLELIEKAVQAEKDGYDVIGLYCSGDPAMDAIREAVSIPVIGAGQSSLQIAVGLGSGFPGSLPQTAMWDRTGRSENQGLTIADWHRSGV